MNAADAFRKIDSDAAEARRGLAKGASGADVNGYLVGIQAKAQVGMQIAEADARKLAAFDGLLAACEALMDRAQHDDECSLYGPRINGSGDCTCFLVEVCAAIASAKEQTAPERLQHPRA